MYKNNAPTFDNFYQIVQTAKDLSSFLSEHIVPNAPPDKIIITGGGKYSPQTDWESYSM